MRESDLLGRLFSGGRSGGALPLSGNLAAAAATSCAEGLLAIFGGALCLAASRLYCQPTLGPLINFTLTSEPKPLQHVSHPPEL